ncbi:ATP-binding protein [Candidatus Gottesmanbacteria bacterium]|nr:ATP-binding protein [Candidatus Gottesmanbacteria bacterium]
MDGSLLKSVLKDQAERFTKQDPGIQREALKKVKRLAATPFAIVVSGLRRAGKSTLLSQIAQTIYHGDCYFVNFEDERLAGLMVADLDVVHQSLIELFGEKTTFLLDEIQNVPEWERFARRMIDAGYKLYIAGSNARLLDKELGTLLTGRYVPIELFPFSFREFLRFKGENAVYPTTLTTSQKARFARALESYLTHGGIPDHLKYPTADWLKTIYSDVLYRDVATRFKISETRALRELSFYLLSNIAQPTSYNKVKELVKLGSVTTVREYVDFLTSAWLFFVVNCYSPSVKKQQIAPKKVYCVDTGLVSTVAFSASANRGPLLENLVFLELKRRVGELYYYKTANNREVDFYAPNTRLLVQVCQSMTQQKTAEREITALQEALEETGIHRGIILTEDFTEESVKKTSHTIDIVPITKWLLTYEEPSTV